MNLPATAPAGHRLREIELSRTTASFEARSWHGRVHGTAPVTSGSITVDQLGNPVAVTAELDLAGIATRNPRRDRDLRSPRMLDAAQFPVMTFVADDVVASMGGWQVRGVLGTGRTESPVVMHVKRGGDCYDGFTATVAITRGELGIRAPGFLIRSAITLRISTCLLP